MEQNMENPPNKSYRYERKFVVRNMDRSTIHRLILNHPALFAEIYHSRYVNNIYFDTLHFNNWRDNLDGHPSRKKFRIRWYGEIFGSIESPNLELKVKNGLIGYKEQYGLDAFELQNGIHARAIKDLVQKTGIESEQVHTIRDQTPVLLNSYQRTYYQSNDHAFRITIDDNQSFYKFSTFNNTFIQKRADREQVIIELKYGLEHDSAATQITNQWAFRISKSSKYVQGMEAIYG